MRIASVLKKKYTVKLLYFDTFQPQLTQGTGFMIIFFQEGKTIFSLRRILAVHCCYIYFTSKQKRGRETKRTLSRGTHFSSPSSNFINTEVVEVRVA